MLAASSSGMVLLPVIELMVYKLNVAPYLLYLILNSKALQLINQYGY